MAEHVAMSQDFKKEVDLTEKITIEKCVNIFDFDKAIKNSVVYNNGLPIAIFLMENT